MPKAQRALDDVEARAARVTESVVSSDAFSEVLARVAGNAVALQKMGSDAADGVVRRLRLAGRRDVVSLGRQLARTEDKLERVLQEVEALQDELRRSRTS